MSFFAKLFGLNQKATVSKDVVTHTTQETNLSNEPSFLELIKKRRSIYAIGKNTVITKEQVKKYQDFYNTMDVNAARKKAIRYAHKNKIDLSVVIEDFLAKFVADKEVQEKKGFWKRVFGEKKK
jgi:hypothetical protein